MTISTVGFRTSAARTRRITAALMLAAVASLVAPSLLSGHAVVYPRSSNSGSFERYSIRVPNEKTVATTRVEIRFPAELRVTAFSDVPGWTLEVVTDSAKNITSAIWTGTLPPQRFAEFPFVARNPKEGAQLVWPVFQTYADGERVEWTGAPGTKAPASVTTLAAAPAAGAAADTATATKPGTTSGSSGWASYLALLLSVVSLGLALRPQGSRA